MSQFVKYIQILLILVVSVLVSCENVRLPPTIGYFPNTPKETSNLEAAYFWTPQNKLTSLYWKDADFVKLTLSSLKKNQLYGDGLINMTGMYNWISSPLKDTVILKAGYDDENIYLLLEWNDSTSNASYQTYKYDGYADPRKPDESAIGWTSQKNSDNISLIFNVEGNTNKDIWQWNMAKSAPFNYAFNLSESEMGDITMDNDAELIQRNGTTSRSQPNYEWSGVSQSITLYDGSKTIIDPAYYLLDDHKMSYEGDAIKGKDLFNTESKAHCSACHGYSGSGDFDDYEEPPSNGGQLNLEFTNRSSRDGLKSFISASSHEGKGYWDRLSGVSADENDLIAFMRSIAGIPGTIVKAPTASQVDIKALTDFKFGNIERTHKGYKVLFIRKLSATGINDVEFSPTKEFKFSVRLSNNDEINYIGEENLMLRFKSNEL